MSMKPYSYKPVEFVGKMELSLVRNMEVVKDHKIISSEVFENGQVQACGGTHDYGLEDG